MVCGREVGDGVVLTVIIDFAQIKTVVTADGVVFCHARHVDVGSLDEIDLYVLSRDILVCDSESLGRIDDVGVGIRTCTFEHGVAVALPVRSGITVIFAFCVESLPRLHFGYESGFILGSGDVDVTCSGAADEDVVSA